MKKIALLGALVGGAYLVYRNLDTETKNKIVNWVKNLRDQLPENLRNLFSGTEGTTEFAGRGTETMEGTRMGR